MKTQLGTVDMAPRPDLLPEVEKAFGEYFDRFQDFFPETLVDLTDVARIRKGVDRALATGKKIGE